MTLKLQNWFEVSLNFTTGLPSLVTSPGALHIPVILWFFTQNGVNRVGGAAAGGATEVIATSGLGEGLGSTGVDVDVWESLRDAVAVPDVDRDHP